MQFIIVHNQYQTQPMDESGTISGKDSPFFLILDHLSNHVGHLDFDV